MLDSLTQELPLCKCGCGEYVTKKQNNFINGHSLNQFHKEKTMNLCNCGCDQYVKNKFVRWHRKKGLSRTAGSGIKKGFQYNQKYIESKKIIRIYECGCGRHCQNRFISGHNLKFVNPHPKKEHIPKLCACGCNQETKNGNKFVNGHNNHETSWNKGLTKETDKRILHHSNVMPKIMRETYAKRGDEIIAERMPHSGWHKFPYIFPDKTIRKMRSSWEVLYAEYLDPLNIKWIYEPKQFKLSNGHRYWPDFYLPELNEYHEVKGFMRLVDQEKIDLFQKEYPDEKLILIRNVPECLGGI